MPFASTTVSRTGSRRVRRPAIAWRPAEQGLDDATISDLSAMHIARMTREELVRLVRAARTPASECRLEYLDRATLQQLAHQARLCCQHRTH